MCEGKNHYHKIHDVKRCLGVSLPWKEINIQLMEVMPFVSV